MIDPAAPRPTRDALATLTHAQLIARYAPGVEAFDPRVLKLSDASLDTAFRPEANIGRWPCRVLLGHLCDAELVFTHRLRRVVGEDNPLFAAWDEEAFIDHALYGCAEPGPNQSAKHPVAAFVAVIHSQRRWMTEWLGTLSDAQWQRKAMHPERGEQTTRVILEYATFHLEHHAWYLNAKVQRLA
ncbi:MAG: DinB family protein [bacterium]|jgi:hypothetical protein